MRAIASSRVTLRSVPSFSGIAARRSRMASTVATVSGIAIDSGDHVSSCGW